MKLEHEICYRALQSRDARFDGQFFTGVRTTGIYCRPICPAPTPKPENCIFLPSAAAAQEAGFRPCLRCRPEISPRLTGAFEGGAVVSRALRLIGEGTLDEQSVENLAGRVGVTERHLRRLFMEHLGASPSTVALTRRILFAKQLLDETSLPVTEVGLAAGFNSLRRFNEVILKTYQRSPRELRKEKAGESRENQPSLTTLKLPYSQPFNWPVMSAFLKGRATAGVEEIGADYYRRTIRLDGQHGLVEVRYVPGQTYLLASIRFPKITALSQIVERLRRVFDLGTNSLEIEAHLSADPFLGRVIKALPGLRVPGTWDKFELAVRAILGQQVSVAAATTLAGRLVQKYGEPLALDGFTTPPDGPRFVYPRPEVLAEADLTGIGIIGARARAISALAGEVAKNPGLLDEEGSLEDSVKKLCELPGIGRWTAHYIAMRALREPDAFPSSDLGLLRAMQPEKGRLTPAQLEKRAESWRPWRAYAALYLWASEMIPPEPLVGVKEEIAPK
jgi:AraC family transcriptional regulator of adaptative response / DNA-3-methyladenine glycosylase II